MTTSSISPWRARRWRPRTTTAVGAPPASSARGGRASAAPGRSPGCCRTWTSEHRLLGGAVVSTAWHHPACLDPRPADQYDLAPGADTGR
ncbi:hypothetical protein ACWCYY_40100 [Kitasatospora sp. NPDC001664]